jgi:glutamyl-tRNA synthetase
MGRPLNAPDGLALKAIELYKVRIKTLSEFAGMTDYFFTDDYSVDEEAVKKYLAGPDSKKVLSGFLQKIEKMKDFSARAIEDACRAMAEEEKIKPGRIIHPTRVAISGKTQGAGLFEMMEVLGKKKVIERLRRAAVSV